MSGRHLEDHDRADFLGDAVGLARTAIMPQQLTNALCLASSPEQQMDAGAPPPGVPRTPPGAGDF